MDIIIRKATREDLLSVQKLSQELFASDLPHDSKLSETWTYDKEGVEYFTERITGEKGICFVALSEEEIIGYATGNIMPILSWRPVKRTELENLIVSEKYRGQKIGEKLVQAFFDWSKEQNVERVMVNAYAANSSGIRFYERVGFTPDSLNLEKILA